MDLAGKRIAVIGNAASAVQFVPQIAPLASQLTIFQRSANWLMPRKDRLYSPRVQRAMTRWPWLAKAAHDFQWFFFGELQLTPLMKQVRIVQWLATLRSKAHLRRQVKDPALRAKLVPDYPIGAKRVLFNDDYYPTLGRANVRLVTDAVERIEPEAVRSKGGERFAADVIIYATGFQATDFLAPMSVTGAGGRDLQRGVAARCARLPRRDRERLPQPVHAVRAEHQPRPQQHPGDDRGAGGLHHRRHPPDGRRAACGAST